MEGDILKKIFSIQVRSESGLLTPKDEGLKLFLVKNVETLVDALYEYARRLHDLKLSQTQLAIFSAIALISAGTNFLDCRCPPLRIIILMRWKNILESLILAFKPGFFVDNSSINLKIKHEYSV